MTIASTQFAQDEVGFNLKNLPVPAAVAALVTGFALVAGLMVGPGGNSFIGEQGLKGIRKWRVVAKGRHRVDGVAYGS